MVALLSHGTRSGGVRSRPIAEPEKGAACWRDRFDRRHGAGAAVVLLALAGSALFIAPTVWQAWSGGVLLLGGALVGMPHGSADFVVAHRVLRPRFGRSWLAMFVSGYLALTGAVLACWTLAPLTTLLVFLTISGLHFGAADRADDGGGLWMARGLARATTPVLPIFLLHPVEVGQLLALLGGMSDTRAIGALVSVQVPLMGAWICLVGFLALSVLTSWRGSESSSVPQREAMELVVLGLAAYLLPPLVAFAGYFCLLHAVRHMADLGETVHPEDAWAAARLVALVIVPAALVCLVLVALFWDGIAGALSTQAIIVAALRLIAALTVPHMLLEWLAERCGSPFHSLGHRSFSDQRAERTAANDRLRASPLASLTPLL